jgi:hypothetical protein
MGPGDRHIAGNGAGGSSVACSAGISLKSLATLLFFFAIAFSPAVKAEHLGAPDDLIIPRSSLEWSVESSALIVRGTVRPGMVKKVVGSNPARVEITLDVTEIIKGSARMPEVTFSAPPMDPAVTWIDLLVFLNRTATARANASSAAAEGWSADNDGVFVLGEKTRDVQILDGSTVTDGETLLKATTAAAKYAGERLEPCDSVVVDDLIVPRDARLEALGRRLLTGDVQQRTKGVNLLSYFNSAENLHRLREILEHDPAFHLDPSEEWTPRLEERWWKEYPVREQALNVLVGWKKSGGVDAELRTPFLRYGPVSWWFWGVWLAVVLLAGILVWRTFGLNGFTTIALIGVSLLVIVGWWRSLWINQSFNYATGGADIEIVSGHGNIALLRVQDDAPKHGWLVRRYGPDETAGGLWFTHYLNPREDLGRGSFRWAEGMTTGNGYSFSLIQLPYWLVMGVLLAWPVARGIGRAGRAMRKRKLATVHTERAISRLRI